MSEKRKRFLFPYILITPGIILLLLVIFLPFLQNVYYSFTNHSLLNPNPSFIGWDNYTTIFFGNDFFPSLGRTLIWVSLNTIFLLVVGLIAAFVLNSKNLRGTKILHVFLLLPWILPEVVTGYTWRMLLNYQTGPYYRLLEFLNLIPQGQDIFSSRVLAMFALVAASVWRSFPLVGILVFAKLQTLPAEQVEAALIDGASRFDIFKNIEMPHVASAVRAIMTLCFIWTFNAFGIIHIMTGGGPASATEVLPIHLQRAAFVFFNFSYSSAFAVMMIIVLVAVVALINLTPWLIMHRKK